MKTKEIKIISIHIDSLKEDVLDTVNNIDAANALIRNYESSYGEAFLIYPQISA